MTVATRMPVVRSDAPASKLHCRNCGKAITPRRARGLCNPCYGQPAVRDRFPAKHGTPRCPTAGNQFRRVPPKQPTDAMPGTWEKMLVMSMRLARGEELYHPHDAPFIFCSDD